ncbi:hypothetical protein [Roseovarius sp. EL26]|uniref:hypothetical protein n=1 Tax=Roseovarius sp. EL26 TaxID=2126672 RepID=UPI000EA2AC3D|nr:hypothetical protein [Roseovarius sp. EL26]
MSFFIAMQNQRAIASYHHPQTILARYNEFLIVKRSGKKNEFLSISNAGACLEREHEAPMELTADLAIFSTFVSQGPNESELFIVDRKLPDGQETIGHHVGGDGCVFLQQSGDTISLGGVIRLESGTQTGSHRNDCPLLAANEPGIVAHFDATYVPWSRELLPYDFNSDRYPRNLI